MNRMTTIQINKQQVLVRLWRKGNPSAQLVGMQTAAATVENSVELPQKIKNETALWPNNYSSGYLLQEIRNTNLKDFMHPYVHCSIIYNCPDLEAAPVSISREWIQVFWWRSLIPCWLLSLSSKLTFAQVSPLYSSLWTGTLQTKFSFATVFLLGFTNGVYYKDTASLAQGEATFPSCYDFCSCSCCSSNGLSLVCSGWLQ